MAGLTSTIVLSLVGWALYIVYCAIWRLYLSPIARFPGPRLAALTHWYELYYDLVKGGKYVLKIRELHEQYGPIIRINPWELHVNDPEFYDDLYAGGGARRDKSSLAGTFGNPESMIETTAHTLHRQRRAPLNKFFSRASITRLEPLIQRSVNSVCDRFREFQERGRVVAIGSAWSCYTNDVVSEYAFGRSYNYVEKAPDFHTDIHDALQNAGDIFHVLRVIPWIIGPMQKLPRWVMELLDPKTLSFINFQRDVAIQIEGIISGKNTSHQTSSHPTIFHEILSSNLPPQEKTPHRLSQEGQTLIGAGTETTAWALSVTTVHILSNPSIRSKLLAELQPLFENSNGAPSFSQLEQLPYLSGVVAEGLRLSYGVTTHLQRICPDAVMKFKDWSIPPGTPVSMSSILVHQDPDIFPSPLEFDPERWIENPGLKRYLVSFSKGSRQCLGMNLAYAEIYLGIAYVLWTFPGMKLFETGVGDVEVLADYFMPKSSGREIQVLL